MRRRKNARLAKLGLITAKCWNPVTENEDDPCHYARNPKTRPNPLPSRILGMDMKTGVTAL